MQTILHNGPYSAKREHAFLRHVTAQRVALLRQLPTRQWLCIAGKRLLDSYEIGIKLILIASVLFGFFQLVTYLLAWSESLLVQIPVLLAWACGAIPLLYRLWWLDLSGERATLSPYAAYSEKMLFHGLLPTENYPKTAQDLP